MMKQIGRGILNATDCNVFGAEILDRPFKVCS